MLQRLTTPLKLWLAITLVVGLLSGCGSSSPVSANNYPLVSISEQGNQKSRVYRAENQSVPDVAHALADEVTPKEISKDDPDRMFLVYPDEWYHVQRDPQKAEDTLIEVSNQEFVRQNYNPSFLQGYITAQIINGIFDLLKSGKQYGDYRGYGTRDIYHPSSGGNYHVPSTQEKKATPPLTVPKSGSIVKRSDKAPSTSTPPSTSGNGSSVGSEGDVTKKGTINKSGGSDPTPKSSNLSPPKSNSPPKTKVGSSGSISKRR
ncbi:MAG TPA: DUF4247 domain-containing protein [Bacillota bacterium]|nr:DUF4247 domain-containing protein [Bacillota bacterium]